MGGQGQGEAGRVCGGVLVQCAHGARGLCIASRIEDRGREATLIHPRVNCVPEHISSVSAQIIVLVGGAILPAPAVPASTRISARLKRVDTTVHP